MFDLTYILSHRSHYFLIFCIHLQGLGLDHTRRRFYEKELSTLSSSVSRDVDLMNSEVNSTLLNCDEAILENRELDALFNRMLAERCGMSTTDSPGKCDSTEDTVKFIQYEYCLDENAMLLWKGTFFA